MQLPGEWVHSLQAACCAHLLLLGAMVCTAHPTDSRVTSGGIAANDLRAFPGAEGFGAYARGGRGGRVIHVTTLADGKPGSLREAIDAVGPRIVVFDVSGTIKLTRSLYVEEPFITIAGQTAPGDGICLRDATLGVGTDHVVIRYLRCRLGDEGRGGDAISIGAGRHIIIDHCSASWSTDEVLSSSTSEPRLSELTVQWCFITEALNAANHGFGSLIRGCRGARYSYHHNFYAHNRGRNPRPGNYDNQNPHDEDPNGLLLDFRNNLIYNWGGSHAGYNADKESVTRLNYVGNYLVPGADSSPQGKAYQEGSTYNLGYFADNYYEHYRPNNPWGLVDFPGWATRKISIYMQSEPFKTGPIVTQEAPDACRAILQSGGASLPCRDVVDQRVVDDVLKGTGRIIKSQSETGGWPELRSAEPPRDSDGDGMPDAWERERVLDPNDASDGPQDRDADGYTNVEDYLNGLVSR